MTKSDALKRSIEIAVERGFDLGEWWGSRIHRPDVAEYLIMFFQEKQLIFDHQFCKALFGEEEVCEECGSEYKDSKFGGYCTAKTCVDNPLSQKAWQYHLTQMVLYEDPLDYLVEYLGKEKA